MLTYLLALDRWEGELGNRVFVCVAKRLDLRDRSSLNNMTRHTNRRPTRWTTTPRMLVRGEICTRATTPSGSCPELERTKSRSERVVVYI